MAPHCLLHEVRKDGSGPPVIFLSDHRNEAAVDAALKSRTGDFALASNIEDPSIARTIRYAIDAKRLRIRCGTFGTRWSSRPTWL